MSDIFREFSVNFEALASVGDRPAWKCSKQGLCGFHSSASKSCSSKPTVCPSKDCRSIRGYYDFPVPSYADAETVVDADVNSHRKLAPKEAPVVTSAAECCAACKSNPKCNIWNYCWDPKGCGYSNSTNDSPVDYNVPDTGSSAKLSACGYFLDRFVKGSKLLGKYGESCTKDDRFPQNFCILQNASEYYQFKNAILAGPFGAHSMTSGKLTSRAPGFVLEKIEPNEWKCFLPLDCYVAEPSEREFCPNKKRICPPAKCRPVRGLYEPSKVLDAETNSHRYPPKSTNYRSSPAACCNECSNKTGCNVWNYCWDPKGCGALGSCFEHNKKYPPSSEVEEIPMSIRGFFTSSCTREGRFPRHFCILRQASARELKTLKRRGSRNAFSWTSGSLA